ncbi:MAG: aspartyl protease family protein [Pyrinomonadaceae bacterium]
MNRIGLVIFSMKADKQKIFTKLLIRHAITVLVLAVMLFSLSLSADSQTTDAVKYEPKKAVKAADKLIQKGGLPDAEKILRDTLADNPNDVDVKLKLAFTLLKMRILGEAYTLSFEAAKADKQNSQAFAILGATLLAGGRFNDARAILDQSLKIDKRNDLALATYGLLEFFENRINISLGYLGEANFIVPDNPDYIFAFAQVAARAERYQEAANAYRKFLLYARDADDDRRARIRGLINFLEYLGVRSSLYSISGKETASVQFELKGNRPVILVKINGKSESLRFVLDTGSGISVISNETSKRLKIKPIARGGHAKGIGGNGKFEIVYGFLKEVEIGEVRVRNVPVYIREFHHNIHDIDGYIGISLISKFLTTIDYGTKSFTLDRLEVGDASKRRKDDLSLPLRLTSSGFLSGEVQMEGVDEPMNFIVDTGASVSVVAENMANREPFISLPRLEALRVVGSAGITENVEAFTLPKISFGEHTRESITAIALDLEIINDASGFKQSGILGGNFFLNYRMTFDFRNSRLLFSPTKPDSADPPEPDEVKSLY